MLGVGRTAEDVVRVSVEEYRKVEETEDDKGSVRV